MTVRAYIGLHESHDVLISFLKRMGTPDKISTIFLKGGNFCAFLFAFKCNQMRSEKGSTYFNRKEYTFKGIGVQKKNKTPKTTTTKKKKKKKKK